MGDETIQRAKNCYSVCQLVQGKQNKTHEENGEATRFLEISHTGRCGFIISEMCCFASKKKDRRMETNAKSFDRSVAILGSDNHGQNLHMVATCST